MCPNIIHWAGDERAWVVNAKNIAFLKIHCVLRFLIDFSVLKYKTNSRRRCFELLFCLQGAAAMNFNFLIELDAVLLTYK